MRQITLGLLFFLAILNTQSLQADGPDAGIEARLRLALRDSMGQLRDAQSQLAALQAAQAQSDKDKADLQAKVDALTAQLKTMSDQATMDKAAADKTIADLKQGAQTLVVHLVDALTTQINGPRQARRQNHRRAAPNHRRPESAESRFRRGDRPIWRRHPVVGHRLRGVRPARQPHRGRACSARGAGVQLQQTVADREKKNVALYQLAGEILARYEKSGVGEALLSKEPFVGLSRVKLENLVQDYRDKLRDHVVIPGQPVAAIQPNTNAQMSSASPGTLPRQ